MTKLVDLADVRIRPAETGDIGYVIQTWGLTLRPEYPEARTNDFVGALRANIGRRLEDGAELLVAYPSSEWTVIYGWLCFRRSPPVVHYVYVRDSHRRGGIARLLIQHSDMGELPIRTDAMTRGARAIKRSHPGQIRYIPVI